MEAIKNKPLDKATFEHFKSRTWRSKNTEYWIDRAFRAEDAADKTTEELLRDMHKVYKNSLAELEKEIQAFYGRYAEENGLTLAEVHKRLDPKQLKSAQEEIKRYYDFAEPAKIGKKMSREYRDELRRLSARAYMSRLEEVKARLKHLVIKLAAEENKAYDKAMKEAYAEAHAQTSYTIDKGLGFSEGYSAPDGDTLAKAVNEKWLGENYSGRIWEDKGRLLTSIENELLTGIAQGHNPRKIADAMATKYGQDYRNCERLARTETLHMMNSATYDSYKEHGVEKYQFVCGLDERTCAVCGALDGTVHELKYAEEGINYPVMHPNCRCTTIVYFEKDEIDEMFEEATRAAYDEDRKIYDVPSSMTYKEWFETIGSDKQQAILGKARYEMKVNGTPLTDFVKNGKLISLNEIRTIQLANKEFPNEKWIWKEPNIYVAEGRNLKGKNEKEKFEKEFEQAKILANHNHCVYLVPETGDGTHYDCIVDGRKTELKTSSGSLNSLGYNYSKAVKQGDDVFIRTSGKESRDIYSKLIGTTKELLKNSFEVKNGSVYIWIDEEKKLHKWNMDKINKKAKELLK